MSFWLFSCYLNRFEAILLATHWKRLGFGYAGIIYGFFLNLNSGVCFDATKTNIPVYLIHLPNKIQINREISSNLMTSKFLSLIFRFFRSIMLFANFWHKICNLLEKKASFSVHLLNFTLEKLNEGWYSKEKDSGQRNYQSIKSLRVANVSSTTKMQILWSSHTKSKLKAVHVAT